MAIDWDKEKEDYLRELAVERFASARSMAEGITKKYKLPCSRNAVIGICHRIGIPLPNRPYGAGSPRAKKTNSTARRHDTVIPQPSAPKTMDGFSGIKVEMQKCAIGEGCKWPIGDVGQPDFHFCDEPRLDGKSYCPSHDALAHVKPNPKADRIVWRNQRMT